MSGRAVTDDEQYPGRKGGSGVPQWLISLMPPHDRYIEPFLGKSPVLRIKRPAGISIGIDVDARVIAWWRRSGRTPGLTTIRKGDALKLLASSAGSMEDPRTLWYFDPPYLGSVRERGIYRHDFSTEEEHASLLSTIAAATAPIMISGYESRLYMQALRKWRLERRRVMSRGGPRIECVWMNFPVPAVLHDPRFYGGTFRERERIKRKRERWTSRLLAMTPGERQIVAEALAAAASSEWNWRWGPHRHE